MAIMAAVLLRKGELVTGTLIACVPGAALIETTGGLRRTVLRAEALDWKFLAPGEDPEAGA